MMPSITVRHNIEMTHRLFLTPGKCQAIHGHSWWVELTIEGPVDASGKILEFGGVKKAFRDYLNSSFDHHLLLNETDPWALFSHTEMGHLPGLQLFRSDPTTENLAQTIRDWAYNHFSEAFVIRVMVWETSVNAASA